MGYIKLDRRLLNWEYFENPKALQLWIYLLLKANWEETEYNGVVVPVGSLITGRRKISKETGLSEQFIRNQLNNLQNNQQITIKTTNKYSLISIVKWADYQGCTDENNQQKVVKPTIKATNKSTTYKEYIRNKEERNTYISNFGKKNRTLDITEISPIYDDSKNPKFEPDELERLLKNRDN